MIASWPLANPWLPAVLLIVAGMLVLRAAPRWGRRRGRVPGLVVLVLAVAAFLNANFAYLPQVGDIVGPRPWPAISSTQLVTTAAHSRTHPRGAVVSFPINGTRSGIPTRSALVYLPPQYFTAPAQRFPVLYLLHGSPGVPLDWFRGAEAATAGLAAAQAGRPVILVAPRMSQSWLDDSECLDRPGRRWETYLVSDVIPFIDTRLRTQAGSYSRGLAGNSAGGFCALSVGLRHPTSFSHVAALSPLLTPTYSYGSVSALFGHPRNLSRQIALHSPLFLLQHSAASRTVKLRLDVGSDDPLAPGLRRFAASARALGSQPVLTVRDGGHTYRVWQPALREAVLWFATRQASATTSGIKATTPPQRDADTMRGSAAPGMACPSATTTFRPARTAMVKRHVGPARPA